MSRADSGGGASSGIELAYPTPANAIWSPEYRTKSPLEEKLELLGRLRAGENRRRLGEPAAVHVTAVTAVSAKCRPTNCCQQR